MPTHSKQSLGVVNTENLTPASQELESILQDFGSSEPEHFNLDTQSIKFSQLLQIKQWHGYIVNMQ